METVRKPLWERGPAARASPGSSLLLVDLLDEVVCVADLVDQRELGLEPVDVFLLLREVAREEIA